MKIMAKRSSKFFQFYILFSVVEYAISRFYFQNSGGPIIIKKYTSVILLWAPFSMFAQGPPKLRDGPDRRRHRTAQVRYGVRCRSLIG